jgi:hypothetical protein
MSAKNRLIALSVLAFTASFILCACNSSGNKGEESQGYKDSLAQSSSVAVDTGNALKADWEKFRMAPDEKIRQNEDSIQVVKNRITKEDAKIKGKLDKDVTRLEEKNNELKARLMNYKEEGKDKFETFKTDFDNSMDSLGVNIKNFFKGKKN